MEKDRGGKKEQVSHMELSLHGTSLLILGMGLWMLPGSNPTVCCCLRSGLTVKSYQVVSLADGRGLLLSHPPLPPT